MPIGSGHLARLDINVAIEAYIQNEYKLRRPVEEVILRIVSNGLSTARIEVNKETAEKIEKIKVKDKERLSKKACSLLQSKLTTEGETNMILRLPLNLKDLVTNKRPNLLIDLAKKKRYSSLKKLISNGAKPDAKDEKGESLTEYWRDNVSDEISLMLEISSILNPKR